MREPLRILSLGAGVQSTTLLMLAHAGELAIDAAVFADTGWEPRGVYDHLWSLAERVDIPIIITGTGDLRADALAEGRAPSLPVFTRDTSGNDGIAPRQCTHDYKTRPVRRVARALGGGPAKADRPVVMVIGISWDELERVKGSDRAYITHEHPLVDRRWRRADCEAYLRKTHGMIAPRSACVGCPFHGDSWWRNIPDDELDDAAEFEAQLQRTTALTATPYLHRNRRPIRDVVAALRAQGTLFGSDLSAECGGSCHT